MAVVLFVIALIVGCAMVGTALARGQFRSPLTFVGIAVVLVLVFLTTTKPESAVFRSVGAKVTVQAQAPLQAQAPSEKAQAPAEEKGDAAKPAPPAEESKAPARVVSKYPSWTMDKEPKGAAVPPANVMEPKASPEQAFDDAVEAIRSNLIEYLQSQQPPSDWVPSQAYVRDLLSDDANRSGRGHGGSRPMLKDDPLQFGVGKKYYYAGVFEVTPSLRTELLRHDRDYRVQQRMLWLSRLLVGLVAILAVVALYLRMDEATKGYYTGWLRVAALGVLGGTALVLFLSA
jgi:hypothetical protein